MSFTIYKMEIKRHLKSFLIWAFSLSAILFLGMMFFPAINSNGMLQEIAPLFENPMMSGMMKAFGVADITSMGSLMGFYVTYNSIYNILLGCIFAAIMAGNLIAKEEADKTAEFLFTKPVSRLTIYLSKGAVLISYLFMLSLVFFLISIISMEVVKGDSPRQLDISKFETKTLISHIEENPEVIYEAFNLDEKSFDNYSLTLASNMLSSNSNELEEMNLNIEDMNNLIEEASQGTLAFFDRVEESPELYMSIFNIPEEGKDEFLENIRGEREEYLAMRADFFNSPDLFITYLEHDPTIALSQYATVEGSMSRTLELLGMDGSFESKIFSQYSSAKLAQICFYIFFLLVTISSLVLVLSLLIKRGKSSMGLSLGMVFFFYFVNSLHGIAKNFNSIVSKVGLVSPFTWIDTDVNRMGFVIEFWRVSLFVGVSAIAFFIGYKILNKKDILV